MDDYSVLKIAASHAALVCLAWMCTFAGAMDQKLLSTRMGQLRVIAFLEGVSLLLLLFVAMPLKYMADMPQMVRIVGMAHGLLFIAYVYWVVMVKLAYNWPIGKTLLALVLSVVPFGTFWADWKLFR